MDVSLLAKTRGILERYHLHARKELSQNFLTDEGILDRILIAAGAGPGETILEVGSGLGILTEALAETGAAVTTLEVDRDLCPILADRLKEYPNVSVLCKSILKFDPPAEWRETKAVGNLPYNLSGKILRWFLDRRAFFSRFDFMLQKEVAERIVSSPGSKAYGVLSVLSQYFTEPEILFPVPAESFLPVPKVESAFIRMTPKPAEACGEKLLVPLVKQAFLQRRKTLLNNLKSWSILSPAEWKDLLDGLSIDERARGEELPVEKFAAMARELGRVSTK